MRTLDIYGNYNRLPCPAEIPWNTRQRLHVNLLAPSFSFPCGSRVTPTPSYIQNDYFLCKSMNEIRGTGMYTCHVALQSVYRALQTAQLTTDDERCTTCFSRSVRKMIMRIPDDNNEFSIKLVVFYFRLLPFFFENEIISECKK